MEEQPAIAPLTKIKLSLVAWSDAGKNEQKTAAVEFSFVFGIGTQGLTAFEMDLIGKHRGDDMMIDIKGPELPEYFEHLRTPLLKTLKADPPFDLNMTVVDIAQVSNRELVHALARKSEEEGCGCGCTGCS